MIFFSNIYKNDYALRPSCLFFFESYNRKQRNWSIGFGYWNLITGLYFVFRISGGLGTMGIKLAKALGNDVMAISSSAHKEALAKVITDTE